MDRISLVKNEYFTVDQSEKLKWFDYSKFDLAIAKTLNCKVFVETRKYRILSQLEIGDLTQRLTTNPNETNIHIVGMGSMTPQVIRKIETLKFWNIYADVTNTFG